MINKQIFYSMKFINPFPIILDALDKISSLTIRGKSVKEFGVIILLRVFSSSKIFLWVSSE